jgi:hypothetical protein
LSLDNIFYLSGNWIIICIFINLLKNQIY